MQAVTDPSDFFIAGGTLRHDVPSYVVRPADAQLQELANRSGQMQVVLATRQMGKSSLMIRAARFLEAEGVHTAIIDLTTIGKTNEESWYLSLLDELQGQLGLNVVAETWWEERPHLSYTKRFSRFVSELIPGELPGSTVIFIDEVDSALNQAFSDDFFAAIRAVHNREASGRGSGRLSIVLLGVATPSALIQDPNRTPFNVGTRIALDDLQREDAEQVLAAGLPGDGKAILERIFFWSNGHPYLTQKIARAVAGRSDESWNAKQVDDLVSALFLNKTARQKDNNLQFINNRIASSGRRGILLSLYRSIVHGAKPIWSDEGSAVQDELKLIGLIKADERGHLVVRNRIYQHVFNSEWLERYPLQDRYHIDRLLSQSGHVTTFLANDNRLGGLPVTLTQIDASGRSQAEVEVMAANFTAEANRLARLSHPRIASVTDTFTEGDFRYVVTEHVVGEPLSATMARNQGGVTEREAVTWASELADILSYLHKQDPSIHLADLSLKSFVVQPRGHLKLADLGLERHLRPWHGHNALQAGTPGYVAPEQVERGQIDARTDVYRLGVILHQLVTGHDPSRTPEKLPAVILLRPDITPKLAEIITQATQANPARRFQTVAALKRALFGGWSGIVSTDVALIAPEEPETLHDGRLKRFPGRPDGPTSSQTLGMLLITGMLSALLAMLLYAVVPNLVAAVAVAILLWAASAFIAYRRLL